MRQHRREKIAILGGGMGGLAAAWAVTSEPGWEDRYEITVHQEGWLLGGKGASTRNRAQGDRIEEHGLHIWLGFYENAFRTIREVYAELGRPASAPLATWDRAFRKHSLITLEDETPRGYRHWHVHTPENDLVPGDGHPLPTPLEYIGLAARQVLHALVTAGRAGRPGLGATGTLARAVEDLLGYLGMGAATVGVTMGVGARHLLGPGARRELLGRLATALRALAEGVSRAVGRDQPADDELRRLFVVVDFYVTNVVGMIREGLTDEHADLSRLDGEEYRAWLRRHGASELTIGSALVRGIYHIAFGYEDGGGAGTVLLGAMRMFLAYRGAIFYKMEAGMGETIFAPLYLALRARGVRFAFFHRVKRLGLSEDRSRVARVVIGRQATLRSGEEYEPLVDCRGLPVWPEAPLADQLVEGEAILRHGVSPSSMRRDWPDVAEQTLELGRDFDHVVLGISLGGLGPICGELVEAEPRWRAMLEKVRTVRTHAVQLWLERDLAGLGWEEDPTVLGSYASPFDTYADMSHLLPQERWPARVQHLAYLCGASGDADAAVGSAEEEMADVTAAGTAWLRRHAGHLFPRASDPATGALDWSALHDPEGRRGEARLGAQYFRTNGEGSERYVLSVAGSTAHRLFADDTGFDNLFVAGDWTRTGLDAGCVEAATLSGLQAARALTGGTRSLPGESPLYRARLARASRLPRYVERPHDVALPPPYAMTAVTLDALWLSADRAALRALVARTLEGPAGGAVTFEPAAPAVVLAAAFTERVSSLDPAFQGRGFMPEADVAFWVPLWAREAGGPRRLVWFLPYVFVDSGAAATAGREVYGFPKSVARIDVQREAGELGRLSLDAHAVARFDGRSGVEVTPLLRIERVPDRGAAAMARVVDALAAVGLPLDRFSDGPVPLVFLKQIRDVARPARAAYQALVEAEARATAVRRSGMARGRYRVRWAEVASHPFAQELGLAPEGQEALAGFSVDFDFVMDRGRELARSSR